MSAQTMWDRGVNAPLESTPQADHMFQQTTREFHDATEERLAGPRLTGEDGVEADPVDWFLDGLMDLGGFRG